MSYNFIYHSPQLPLLLPSLLLPSPQGEGLGVR